MCRSREAKCGVGRPIYRHQNHPTKTPCSKEVRPASGMNKFPAAKLPDSHSIKFLGNPRDESKLELFSKTVSQSAPISKMFRPRFPRIPIQRLPIKRCFATQRLPTLRHDFSSGVPDLMSAPAFDISWTQYQTMMIDKLNQLLAGRLFLPYV
jgi:hypothetical protein